MRSSVRQGWIGAASLAAACGGLLGGEAARGQEAPAPAWEARPESALVLPAVGRGGRVPFPLDTLMASVVDGTWRPVIEGDEVERPDGFSVAWSRLESDEPGVFEGRTWRGGWMLLEIQSESPRPVRLEIRGHSMAFINGRLRVGDLYGFEFVHLPVMFNAGPNYVLLQGARGNTRVRALAPEYTVEVLPDVTLPDYVVGQDGSGLFGQVVLSNYGFKAIGGARALVAYEGGDGAPIVAETALPSLPGESVRPVRVDLPSMRAHEPGTIEFRLRILAADGSLLGEGRVRTRAVGEQDVRVVTFGSKVDGSVQKYALRPASSPEADGLVLSTHGAGVDAPNQAAAYSAKDWAHLVAPTNRRPFGFDWEDWGRLDAIEALEHAQRTLATAPEKTWLTGHSMGGHGAWHLATTFPDRFAAVGSSAGWVDFWSYGAADLDASDPVAQVFRRATLPSRTLMMQKNLASLGVYILHGDADETVPVREARTMRDELSAWHDDVGYHEQPGAGHWWDTEGPGAACVDWPPMFEMFQRRTIDLGPTGDGPDELAFVTAFPGVNARHFWARVEQQTRPLEPSELRLRRERGAGGVVAVTGETSNIARLRLRLGTASDSTKPPAAVRIELDGQRVRTRPVDRGGTLEIRLDRDDASGRWRVTGAIDESSEKTPARSGLFKSAFNHRPVLVYGTGGSPEENLWAVSRARYDAERFWYRGNGLLETVADRDFEAGAFAGRSVILYGNRDTNRAWGVMVPEGAAMDVRAGAVRIGDDTHEGERLGLLGVLPRPDDPVASVGLIGGTCLAAMRAGDHLPIFTSGVAYPDFTLFEADVWRRGMEAVRVAGFLGNDWSVERGEMIVRETED
ncbi:MAG: hypothetical protein EA378_04255 [Phycisphaerales bacterium]|nr:MAG: hypothetical protein EA378_04255 [Phycisphaerales bacterium]